MAKVFIDKDKIVQGVQDPAKKFLIALGYAIEAQAKRNQKEVNYIDTGRSMASISTNWTGSGMDRKAMTAGGVAEGIYGIGQPQGEEFTVVVGSNVFYFPYIELGTKKIRAGAMLRNALAKYVARIRGAK